MPTVEAITARVLSGHNVVRNGSDYMLVADVEPNLDVYTDGVSQVVEFVNGLHQLCNDYFESQEKDRAANYEDIAYVARQIADGLLSEYENPALLPLNERLSVDSGRSPDELAQLAGTSADYIDDVVRGLLDAPPRTVDHLTAVVDGLQDATVDGITLATLNHDLVLEHALRASGTDYSDGFEDDFGTLRVWNDTFNVSNRKFLKLHGSIDWWRYTLTRDDWTGQVTARDVGGDPFHARGPNGELLDYPAGGRPQLLTGTFNKILSYPSGIYADQHFRFHEALGSADVLVVIGYGFRDKAINARIVAWAERPGEHRMIVVHANPFQLGAGARGAIRGKWSRWHQNGLLRFIPQYLSSATTWGSIRALAR